MTKPMYTYPTRDAAINAAVLKLGKRAKPGKHFALLNYGRRAWWYEYAETCGRRFASDDEAFAFAEAECDDRKCQIGIRYTDGTAVTIDPVSDDVDDIDDEILPTARAIKFAPMLERAGSRGRKPNPDRSKKVAKIAERAARTGVTSDEIRNEFGFRKQENLRALFFAPNGKRGICDNTSMPFVSKREWRGKRQVTVYYIGPAALQHQSVAARQLELF